MIKLNWNQFIGICQTHKPTNFTPPDLEKVKVEIASRLGAQNDETLSNKLIELREKYLKFMESKKRKHSVDRSVAANAVVLNSEEVTGISVEPAKERKAKSLGHLGDRQLKNRTNELWEKVKEYAEENQKTPLRILSLLQKQCKDKNARDVGDQVCQQSKMSIDSARENFISIDYAIGIMVDCNVGRVTYAKLGKILKKEGHNSLPPWIHVRTTC